MKKPEVVTIRLTTEIKALLVKQARAQNRSMTAYLEWLVMQDSDTTRATPKNRCG